MCLLCLYKTIFQGSEKHRRGSGMSKLTDFLNEEVKGKNLLLGRLLCSLLIYLGVSRFFPVLPRAGLDPSWMEVINWSISQKILFGQDLIFTYGPLGILEVNTIAAHSFPVALFYLLLSLLYGYALPLSRKRGELILEILLLLPLVSIVPRGVSFFTVLYPFLCFFTVESESKYKRLILSCLAVAGACFILAKFMHLVPVFCGLLAVDLLLIFRKKYPFMLGIFAGAFLLLWLLCGQSITVLPQYFLNSFHIALGYVEAMATIRIYEVIYIFPFIACWVYLLVTGSILYYHRIREKKLLYFYLFFIFYSSFFVIGKYASTLMDKLHIYYAAGSLAAVAYFLCLKKWRPFLPVLLFLCVFVFFCREWESNWRDIPDVFSGRYMERHEEARKKLELPLEEKYKNMTIDSFPWDISEIIHTPGLIYTPRPVFQSYSCYTPHLQEQNLAFYRKKDSPDLLLWRFGGMDGRLPLQDDGNLYPVILGKYFPVDIWKLVEGERLLLKKRKDAAAGELPLTFHSSGTFPWKAPIPIPSVKGKLLWCRLRIEYRFPGKIWNLFWRPPGVFIRFYSKDKEFILSRRIIPGMVKNVFLLSPAVIRRSDLVEIYNRADMSERLRYFSLNVSFLDYRFHDPLMTSFVTDHLMKKEIHIEYYTSPFPAPLKELP